MNNDNIGKFISELRKKKGLTQEELAKKIFVTRETISKWERGKNIPEGENLSELAAVLETTMEEILLGRKIDKNEDIKKELEDRLEILTNDNNEYRKKNKLYLQALVIVFMLFCIFLICYYYFNIYNTVKMYTINYSDDIVSIHDGIFITSKDKMYFNLPMVNCKDEILKLKLYSKINNIEDLIYEIDDTRIVIYDFYGYEAFFNYENLNEILDNLYLDINCESETYTIKLEFQKIYSNNKLFTSKKKKAIEENNSTTSINKIIGDINTEKIKEKFKKTDDMYVHEEKNRRYIYNEQENFIVMIENNKEWYYYINNNILDYNNNDITFSYVNNTIDCNDDNCNKYIKELNYFFENLNNILK